MPNDYFAVREAQVKGAYSKQINDFLQFFNPAQKTVVLIPGIAGSQLLRSRKDFTAYDGQPFNLANYETAWLEAGA